jgi:hypothetical protein
MESVKSKASTVGIIYALGIVAILVSGVGLGRISQRPIVDDGADESWVGE